MEDKEEASLLQKEEGFPLTVIYCGICKLPPEYCEFGTTVKECREWLQRYHPELAEKIEQPAAEVISVSESSEKPQDDVIVITEEKKVEDEENDKKEVKFEEPAPPPANNNNNNNNKKKGKKEEVPKIKISLSQRNKKKHITTITGISTFGIKPKEAAKFFANKYACGSSVVKDTTDVIDIQGDVINTISNLITTKWKNVQESDIIFVEEKKKK